MKLILCLVMLQFLGTAQAVNSYLVKRQLMENYNYLIDSQVACEGDYEHGQYICDKNIAGSRRMLGTWDSFIIPVVVKNSYPVRYVDSNMFVTAHTLFPLFLVQFEDEEIERERLLSIEMGMKAINSFQRKDSFAFWPEIGPSVSGQVNRIGPLNLSPLLLSTQLNIVKRVQDFMHIHLFPKQVRWMEAHLDLENKSLGMDAFFSVPNDADDTALGIASNLYFHEYYTQDRNQIERYKDMADVFAKYTDDYKTRQERRYKSYLPECKSWVEAKALDSERYKLFQDKKFLKECSLDDPREAWRYDFSDKHSGAFMTWLYDENKEIYETPEFGVALPGQNSIDCNVVSNVLYALSLTGKRDSAANRNSYEKSCNAISHILLNDEGELRIGKSPRPKERDLPVWRYCGLFYPAHMTFPYLISKAIQEVGACQDLPKEDQEKFDLGMERLTEDLIREQDEVTPFKAKGLWYEKIDSTTELPTALGAASLLNLKRVYADKFKISSEEWKTRIEKAIDHILKKSRRRTSQDGNVSAYVPEGTFFGGGTVDEIAHWRSSAFATSISMEVMVKYLMSYELKEDKRRILSINKDNSIASIPFSQSATLPSTLPNRKKDILPPLKQYNRESSRQMGLRRGSDGTEAIIGIELSEGKILSGHAQEPEENVAYYRVKLTGQGAFDIESGALTQYNINTRFLGISTKSTFIINDEIAYLPIQYVKEEDIRVKSLYLAYGDIDAPVLKLGSRAQLNLQMTGKLVGAVHKSNAEGSLPGQRTSLNLGEFNIGFKVKTGKLVIGVSGQTELGVSHSAGENYSSHRNYSLHGNITYQFNDRHSLELVARKSVDGPGRDLFKDDRYYVQYRYTWSRGR